MFVAKTIPAEHRDLIHDVSYDFHGRRMATCSSDQFVKVCATVYSFSMPGAGPRPGPGARPRPGPRPQALAGRRARLTVTGGGSSATGTVTVSVKQ